MKAQKIEDAKLDELLKAHENENISWDRDKIIIDNILYDIVNADKDRAKNEIYFYLEEVRELVNA